MNWLLYLVISIGMTACHATVTSPMLFAHGSSAAFDMSIGIWVINISFVLMSVFVLCVNYLVPFFGHKGKKK